MTGRVQQGFRAIEDWSGRYWQNLMERLRIVGLWPTSPEGLEPVEGIVQRHAFEQVEPSYTFREDLRKNLTVAAQLKNSGLVIEYPKPIRELILLGASAALLIACITTLVLIFRSHSAHAGPST